MPLGVVKNTFYLFSKHVINNKGYTHIIAELYKSKLHNIFFVYASVRHTQTHKQIFSVVLKSQQQ